MTELSLLFPPPPSHPAHDLFAAQAKREAERDLSIRLWMRNIQEQFPSFMLTRMEGGTQFQVANVLRDYFLEYANRLAEKGPYAFPTSFNVVESFLDFSHRFFAFDIREEREHLLRLHEYIDWYTDGTFPEDPKALTEILPEGIVYSYNMVGPMEDFRLPTGESELVILGVGFVRHSTELSVMAIVGESPPFPSDEVATQLKTGTPPKGKEGLEPHPSYTVANRYFEEVPGFSKVIALVRFDLASRRYVVRYVNLDLGASYLVVTDDPLVFPQDMTRKDRAEHLDRMAQDLSRYDSLFASLATLMYLPAFFISEHGRITRTEFATELHVRRASTKVRKAARLFGRKAIPFFREVLCLESDVPKSGEEEQTITPPELEFASSGFWKSLPPGKVGENESGKPIVGKTWVERTESWSRQGLEAFVVRKHAKPVQGPNPGYVYVMRSGSHGIDLYKIGLTRREPNERAQELTQATGVPTSFEILARWEAGDVVEVEREAHRRLKQYKVNKRREFFRVPLAIIIKTINNIVRESA